MQEIDLDYGLSKLSIELPDSAIIVRYGQTYQDPPTIDPVIMMTIFINSMCCTVI